MKTLSNKILESLLDDEDNIINKEYHLDTSIEISPYNYVFGIYTEKERRINDNCLYSIAGLLADLKIKRIKRQVQFMDIKANQYRFNVNDKGMYIMGKNPVILCIHPDLLNNIYIKITVNELHYKTLIPLGTKTFICNSNGFINDSTYKEMKQFIKERV